MPVHALRKLLLLLAASSVLAGTQALAADAAQYRADLYYNLAEGNYRLGDIEAASRVIDQILRIQPRHEAALQLQQRIKSGPSQSNPAAPPAGTTPPGLDALANQSTLATLGRAIEADPAMQDLANYLRGRAALAKGRAGTAREHFEKALRQLPAPDDPLRPHILFHHALCLERLNRPQRAEAGLLAALEAGYLPESQADALQAARILLRIGQHERARPILEAIALNHPDPTPQAWAMLGRAHQAANLHKRAVSAYSQSLQLSPDQPGTLALRAGLLRRLGQLDQAEADYQSALQHAPEDPAIHYALGLLQIRLGKIEQARQSLRQACKSEPAPQMTRLLLALLAHAQGDLPHARRHLAQYLETAPPEQHNETAFFLDYNLASAAGKREQAIHTLRQRAEATGASASLGAYLAYCTGQKTRKELLDLAGKAPAPGQARKQICETAYWMAQHQAYADHAGYSRELLQIARRNGSPEWIEHQLAEWQLQYRTSE